MPDYEGRIAFINAITDDASAQALAADFSFQYIPTSFFLDADGTVIASKTGPLTEQQLRDQLDSLVDE